MICGTARGGKGEERETETEREHECANTVWKQALKANVSLANLSDFPRFAGIGAALQLISNIITVHTWIHSVI